MMVTEGQPMVMAFLRKSRRDNASKEKAADPVFQVHGITKIYRMGEMEVPAVSGVAVREGMLE